MNALDLVKAMLQEAIDADLVFTTDEWGASANGKALQVVIEDDGRLLILVRRLGVRGSSPAA